jgi:predicted rRNA pseudouridine synthase
MKDIKELLNFGLINFDKPAGPTSFSVSEFVCKKLGLKKTSHMGTLDPKVTGVLPITLGRACKLAGYFIKHDKSYVGVLETHRECDIVELQKLIDDNFVGKIRQTPPHRSAVARVEREREVYSWKLIEASENGKGFLFKCKVEGGTYIRKLCSDLGEMIGGAHMGELRRTGAGIFGEEKMVDLYGFEEAVEAWKSSKDDSGEPNGDDGLLREMVVPAEEAIREVLPVIEVDKSALKSLYVGRPLLKSNVVGGVDVGEGEIFALFCGNVFVGVYRRSEGGVFGRAEFVYTDI